MVITTAMSAVLPTSAERLDPCSAAIDVPPSGRAAAVTLAASCHSFIHAFVACRRCPFDARAMIPAGRSAEIRKNAASSPTRLTLSSKLLPLH